MKERVNTIMPAVNKYLKKIQIVSFNYLEIHRCKL